MFKFDKSKKIILYGAATIGTIIGTYLTNENYNICGVIDKRAGEIESLLTYKVYNLEKFADAFKGQDVIVIISVKNVFEHNKIATILMNEGFDQLIYKPYSVLNGTPNEDEIKIANVYDDLLEKGIKESYWIPKTKNIINHIWRDGGIIENDKDEIVANIPLEVIFTNYNSNNFDKWSNKHILMLYPHINIFSFWDGQKGNMEDYIQYCCDGAKHYKTFSITNSWKENILQNRLDVFTNMNNYMERDYSFFIRNAPTAKMNKSGYYNLTGGKHRATFEIAKNKKYIPLKITKEDYMDYISLEKFQPVFDYLDDALKNNIEIDGYIEHPYFYDFPFQNCNFYRNITESIIFYFGENYVSANEFKEVICIDGLNDLGLLGRFFSRMQSRLVIKNLYNVHAKTLLLKAMNLNFNLEFSGEYDDNNYKKIFLLEYVDFVDMEAGLCDNESAIVYVPHDEKTNLMEYKNYFISKITSGMRRFKIYDVYILKRMER